MTYKDKEQKKKCDRERYYRNRDKLLAQKRAYRIANIDKFKEKDRVYNILNKNKIKERARKKYLEKSELIKNSSKRYYQDNKERQLEVAKEYYLKNKESILRRNKNRIKDSEYKIRTRVYFHKRRSQKMATQDGTVTTTSLKELLKTQDNKCNMCKTELCNTNMHLDHIIPLCLGGTHRLLNVQWLCARCNLTKPKRKVI